MNALQVERKRTAASLEALTSGRPTAKLLARCLSGAPIDIRLLGLPSGVTACIFDVEGVLTTSTAAHREAWGVTLDSFLYARAERLHHPFFPFDPRHDYPNHLAGRPLMAGLRAFLASRGISLPEGEPSDLPGTESMYGLANRKQQVLHRHLQQQGVEAYAGSRAYLAIARIVGALRAVVSVSTNTPLVLDRAGIADLIEQTVDGRTLEADSLRPKPAPDMLLAACDQLAIDPIHAVAFETTPAGISAARSAGVRAAIGVVRDENVAALSASDADLVVNDLGELLQRGLGRRGQG